MAKVLVAYDEPLTLRLLAHAVESTGHIAIRCSNGIRALDTLIDNPDIELLVTDVSMPGMNGDELTALLSTEDRFKRLPIIVCSGRIDMSEVVELLDLGAATCLSKPVDRNQLIKVVLNLIGQPKPIGAI